MQVTFSMQQGSLSPHAQRPTRTIKETSTSIDEEEMLEAEESSPQSCSCRLIRIKLQKDPMPRGEEVEVEGFWWSVHMRLVRLEKLHSRSVSVLLDRHPHHPTCPRQAAVAA